jgi:hypothetical protein
MADRQEPTLAEVRGLPTVEEKPLLNLLEAASWLRLSRGTAYALARTDSFPVPIVEIGRRYFVRNAELRAFLGLADPAA